MQQNSNNSQSSKSSEQTDGFVNIFKRVFGLSLLSNYYPQLHGIRVLAIISVIQVHVTMAMGPNGARMLKGWRFGHISPNIFFGMDLFFILSGFLIGSMLMYSMSNAQQGRGRARIIGRFYLRRSFRTFPLYYAMLILFPLILALSPERTANYLNEIFYLSNYGNSTPETRIMHWGWSLSVEEHFYLTVPLFLLGLGLLKTHRGRISWMVIFWCLALLVRLYIFFSHPLPWPHWLLNQRIYIRTHTRFDILIAGVLLAYLQHNFKDTLVVFFKNRAVRWTAWFIVISCFLILTFRPKMQLADLQFFKMFAWGTITSIMYVPMILLLLNTKGWLQRLLSARFFLFMATLGYGVYLIHIPIAYGMLPWVSYIAQKTDLTASIIWPGYLAATWILSVFYSYILHLLIEKPMLYLRDKLAP